MEQSESIGELAKAMAAVQQEMGTTVGKDAVNPHFRNRYATLAACKAAALPVLAKHGVWLSQGIGGDGERVTVTTQLTHVSGQWQRSTLTLRAQKTDPQGAASASTYGCRYGLLAMVGLAPADDDDGEAASRAPARHTERRVPSQRDERSAEAARDAGGYGPADLEDELGATDPIIPFGKNKGERVSELNPRNREWYTDVYRDKLAKDPTSRFADEWRTLLAALEARAA